VFRACPRSTPTVLPIRDAIGCVLAADVSAIDAVPPFRNSAMDGFALNSADTGHAPVALHISGTTLAGDPPADHLVPGNAQRIMTGAPVPPGADAVCMIELTRDLGNGDVEIGVRIGAGENIREAGSDVAAGDECFAAGTVLSPAHVGVLVSVGVRSVEVFARPRVGVLSTGDELVGADDELATGKIRDSNRPTLLARLASDGFSAVDLGSAVDDAGAIAHTVEQALPQVDAVITVGGVSVGDHDFLAEALAKLGAAPLSSLQVAIRPAKPFAFGVLPAARVPVFGLPGNPVSALVSYELIVRPALRSASGHSRIDRPLVSAVVPDGLGRAADGRTHFVRVHLRGCEDGTFEARVTRGQGSHQLRSFADADGLAVVADGDGVAPGGRVGVLVLRDDALVPEGSGTWIP
jgi:molybdopterin molybdotransferase